MAECKEHCNHFVRTELIKVAPEGHGKFLPDKEMLTKARMTEKCCNCGTQSVTISDVSMEDVIRSTPPIFPDPFPWKTQKQPWNNPPHLTWGVSPRIGGMHSGILIDDNYGVTVSD